MQKMVDRGVSFSFIPKPRFGSVLGPFQVLFCFVFFFPLKQFMRCFTSEGWKTDSLLFPFDSVFIFILFFY